MCTLETKKGIFLDFLSFDVQKMYIYIIMIICSDGLKQKNIKKMQKSEYLSANIVNCHVKIVKVPTVFHVLLILKIHVLDVVKLT